MRLSPCLALGLALLLVGCTTRRADPVSSRTYVPGLPEQLRGMHLQVKAMSDNPALSEMLRTTALERFAKVLPVGEAEPFDGCLELSLVTDAPGVTVGFGNGPPGPPDWGPRPFRETYYNYLQVDVLLQIKDRAGKRLWSARFATFDRAVLAAGKRAIEALADRLQWDLASQPPVSPGSPAPGPLDAAPALPAQ